MIHDHGYICLSLPLPTAHGVPVSLSFPLPTAQDVLTSFSLPSSITQHGLASSCLVPYKCDAALHGPASYYVGTLMIQAPLVTHRYRTHWRLDFSWKYMSRFLEALPSLFKFLSFFPLHELLHHFVVSMQTVACVCSVGHLPPYRITMLLQRDLRRSLCSNSLHP